MPFLLDSSEDELKKKQQEAAQNLSGSSSIINNPNAPQSKPGAPKQSGSWTNLQSYLDANKENAGAMSDKITSTVDNQGQTAQTKINEFQNGAPSETKKYTSEDLTSEFYNDPTKNVESYTKLKNNGGYDGPQSVDKATGYADAQSSTSKAKEQVKNLQNESGRTSLLVDAYGRPNYSQGSKSLDNLLLQNDPTSKSKFNDTAQKWRGLNSLLDNANTTVSSSIDNNKKTAFDNMSLIPGAEEDYLKNFLQPIEKRASDFNSNADKKRNSITNDISDDVLNQETMDFLGLTNGDDLYDTSLNSFINPNYTTAGLDNVATTEERAKYAALQKLIGGTDSRITSDGKSINPISFDKDGFNAAITKAKEARNVSDEAVKQKHYSINIDGNDYEVTNLSHVIASAKSPEQYLRDNGWNMADPQIQSLVGQLNSDLNTLKSRRRVNLEGGPALEDIALTPSENMSAPGLPPGLPSNYQSPTPDSGHSGIDLIGAIESGAGTPLVNDIGMTNSPSLGIQTPTVQTPQVDVIGALLNGVGVSNNNTGLVSSPTLGVQLPTIQIPKIKFPKL